MQIRTVLKLTVMLSALAIGGCATTRGTGITTHPGITAAKAREARCGRFEPLTYSASKDTKRTVKGIRRHNAYGKRRGCWK